MSAADTVEQLKAKLSDAEETVADLTIDLSDAEEKLRDWDDRLEEAASLLRAGRIEDALWSLERALPHEFIGFAETILRWKTRLVA